MKCLSINQANVFQILICCQLDCQSLRLPEIDNSGYNNETLVLNSSTQLLNIDKPYLNKYINYSIQCIKNETHTPAVLRVLCTKRAFSSHISAMTTLSGSIILSFQTLKIPECYCNVSHSVHHTSRHNLSALLTPCHYWCRIVKEFLISGFYWSNKSFNNQSI